MRKRTSSQSSMTNPEDKGESCVWYQWWKSEKDRQCVFSPVLSSPAQYKDTGNRNTSWQQKEKKKTGREMQRKRERKDRAVIHGGKRADSKEMWGFGGLPLESNILGFTHKSHLKVGRLRGAPAPPSQMPQTCSQPQALVSLSTGFSRWQRWMREEERH